MRIGIVTDIHEAAGELRRALTEFRARGVDAIVSLGDVCNFFEGEPGGADESIALLEAAGATPVSCGATGALPAASRAPPR
jgi:hypothetical protein